MPVPITVPRLGWNMEEGTFVEWLKADGDPVRAGEAVFKLESEKSTEDVESLDGGTLHIPATAPQPGSTVKVGQVIGYLLLPGEAPPSEPMSAPETLADPAPAAAPAVTVSATLEQPPTPTPAISPRARRLATALGVELSQFRRGSGRTGRVRERDVAALAAAPESDSPEPSSASAVNGTIPLSAIRQATAARMVESRKTTAPVTLTAAVDATNLVNLRHQFRAAAPDRGGPVPTYTDFLVKLAGFALQKHPALASRWTDAGLCPASRIDIGIAVDTEAGLLVPVIHDVPALGLRKVAIRSRELIEFARAGKLPAREMDGACFTITNLGSYGIDAFTPIINPPEAAILGVGRIERRPVIRGAEIVAREIVTLSLTFDHRVVDGGPAARFLQTLAQLIENPGPWVSS